MPRALCLALLALVGCPASLVEPEFRYPERVLSSSSLRLRTDLQEPPPETVLVRLEAASRAVYARLLPADRPPLAPFAVIVFQEREDFLAFYRDSAADDLHPAGFIQGERIALHHPIAWRQRAAGRPVAWGVGVDERDAFLRTFAHELFHGLRYRLDVQGIPAWLEEGLATAVGLELRPWKPGEELRDGFRLCLEVLHGRRLVPAGRRAEPARWEELPPWDHGHQLGRLTVAGLREDPDLAARLEDAVRDALADGHFALTVRDRFADLGALEDFLLARLQARVLDSFRAELAENPALLQATAYAAFARALCYGGRAEGDALHARCRALAARLRADATPLSIEGLLGRGLDGWEPNARQAELRRRWEEVRPPDDPVLGAESSWAGLPSP